MLATADGASYTVVGYNYTSDRLFVDHRHSSRHANSTVVQTAPLHIQTVLNSKENDQKVAHTSVVNVTTSDSFFIELVSIVDCALVETFVNRQVALSSWM